MRLRSRGGNEWDRVSPGQAGQEQRGAEGKVPAKALIKCQWSNGRQVQVSRPKGEAEGCKRKRTQVAVEWSGVRLAQKPGAWRACTGQQRSSCEHESSGSGQTPCTWLQSLSHVPRNQSPQGSPGPRKGSPGGEEYITQSALPSSRAPDKVSLHQLHPDKKTMQVSLWHS